MVKEFAHDFIILNVEQSIAHQIILELLHYGLISKSME
jgi:hypothetical protein